MEGVSEGGAFAHPLGPVATAVGEIDRLSGRVHCFLYASEGDVEFAEIAVSDGSVLPILRFRGVVGCGPHVLDGVGQPADGGKDTSGLADHPRLSGWPKGW